jgi:aspartate/methionine/tyrosine aminotransferase
MVCCTMRADTEKGYLRSPAHLCGFSFIIMQEMHFTTSTGNCRVLQREGGWYAIVDILDMVSDEARVMRLLKHDNILVHPGFFYDFNREGFVVVSLLPGEDIFRSGVSRLIGRYGHK